MPRFHVIGALLVSLALIVGALWSRFDDKEASVALIALNENGEAVTVDEMSVDEYLEFDSMANTQSEEKLNQTELLSRQLVTEYFSLSSRNGATSENLVDLGKKLADAIVSNEGIVATVKLEQVKIVADSNDSLVSYHNKLSQLRSKYSTLGGGDKEFESIFDTEFKNTMSKLSSLSADAARELLTFSVPASLAGNHLRLVNNYLSTSKASMAVSLIEEDPVGALSALNTLAKNSEEEEGLISAVQILLMSKGLFSGNI
jgi:hypothetical protein